MGAKWAQVWRRDHKRGLRSTPVPGTGGQHLWPIAPLCSIVPCPTLPYTRLCPTLLCPPCCAPPCGLRLTNLVKVTCPIGRSLWVEVFIELLPLKPYTGPWGYNAISRPSPISRPSIPSSPSSQRTPYVSVPLNRDELQTRSGPWSGWWSPCL